MYRLEAVFASIPVLRASALASLDLDAIGSRIIMVILCVGGLILFALHTAEQIVRSTRRLIAIIRGRRKT